MGETFKPGVETWYASDSPVNDFSAVFEDDGQTGYFYAYDRAAPADPILDGVHIYNVADVSDRANASVATIIWSTDGLKAALLINGHPHAVIHFGAKRSYCRTGFPPPSSSWGRGGWNDDLMKLFPA